MLQEIHHHGFRIFSWRDRKNRIEAVCLVFDFLKDHGFLMSKINTVIKQTQTWMGQKNNSTYQEFDLWHIIHNMFGNENLVCIKVDHLTYHRSEFTEFDSVWITSWYHKSRWMRLTWSRGVQTQGSSLHAGLHFLVGLWCQDLFNA